MSSTESQMGEAALAFRDLTLSSGDRLLLHNVTGFVPRGGITAVLGPSASGKSVLMQTLSARIQVLRISGTVFMDGKKVNPKSRSNPIAYVPQEDSLQGEFTAREVTFMSAVLKRADPADVLKHDVDDLMNKLGLAHVADGIIGTLIFRGLSGGQKKRVEVSTELIASPSVLLLDEPTSGLDSSVAFDVLQEVRSLVKASEGKLSVMLSIHQPNSRILELFDNIILIDQGASIFSGTLPEASAYFSRLGFDCPPSVTPTDYFLKISDSNFKYTENFDFEEAYLASAEHAGLVSYVDQVMGSASETFSGQKATGSVSFFTKFYRLVHREYALAFRDPTLYYFQVNLLYGFGFITGAVFFKLPLGIDANYNQIPGAILWFSLMNGWIHAFKVYHITNTDKRTRHEVGNNKYSALTFCAADLVTTATLSVLFFPTAAISFAMIGFPQSAFPFLLLNYWMTSLASEAMISFICKFSENPTVSMIFTQIVLVNTMVFGGGVFLPWKDCPDYWIWVQEMSIFTQSSRAAIMEIFNEIQFACGTVINGNVCVNAGTGDQFPCSTPVVNGKCLVDARVVLEVTQGVGRADNYWYYFAYICAIFCVFKFFVVLFTVHPWANLMYSIKSALRITHSRAISDLASKRKEDKAAPSDAQEKPSAKLEAVKQASMKSHLKPSLTWTQLSVVLPKGNKVLIDSVSGHVSSGRVLALMGPSGAGKTTLLNALARKANYAKISGQILFAGRAMTPTDLTYVPQFDQVNGTLTVEEHLMLVGKLTCLDVPEMLERLEILLSILGLSAKRHTPVSRLTGGEVKRVSIGIGLISKPNVLFLDEPTTGLDSTAAFAIVNYLSEIAATMNIAVILTIHQPSALVFDMLDDLLLLENGRIVYGGSIEDAAAFFAECGHANPKKINPSDYYLDLVQKPPSEGELWCNLFAGHRSGSHFIEHIDSVLEAKMNKEAPSQPSAVVRFGTMFRYFMSYFLAERGFYVFRLGALILIAVFVGTLYLRLEPTTTNIINYIGAMFFTIIAMMLTAVSSTALLAKDRYEAVDRVGNGIFTPAIFVTAQTLASLVYCLLVSFVFVCIFHWLVNINPFAEAFLYDWMMSWICMAMMEAVLLNLIEVMKNAFLCTTSAMIFLGSIMAFCGFFRAVKDMVPWISWMSYIFPLKYVFDGLATQIFHTQNFKVTGSNPALYISGDAVLKTTFNLENVNSWGMWGVAIAYLVVLRFNQYFLFAYQTGTLFTAPAAVGTIQKATITRSNASMERMAGEMAAGGDRHSMQE